MSSHSISKRSKCWACAFYSCKRELKHGIFLGDSVDCDNKGICTNPKSTSKDKTVFEDNSCPKFAMWALLESALAQKEAEKEAKRESERNAKIAEEMEMERAREEQLERYRREEAEREEREQQAELKRQRRAIEEERQKLAEERKKLEYDRWYMSLSDEEKKAEDERIAKEEEEKRIQQQKEQELARIRAQQQADERKKQQELAEQRRQQEEKNKAAEAARIKKRNKIIIFSAMGAAIFIIALIIIIVSISLANSPKKKINEYLEKYPNSKYTETINVTNWNAQFSIESKMKGEFFSVDVVYNLKNTYGGFDTAHTWMSFTYGDKSDFEKERSIIVSSGSNKVSVIISFELKNNPSIKMTSYKIDYKQGDLNLTGSSYYYCETLISEMYKYTDSFLKKVNSSYSLW